ncbi:hypothetical protein DTO027B5_3874 [Paecilomyces variotii]|nr:hypothetical protein DTO207G8_2113 [Paecilomyces variotii]KAJ9325846.1 hypothetical protein DTO027B3_3165 [Paecilomyces variotii]KAJ9334392.1 hypothetical protein DTO027B5_3874 [Paecilomyces variotii]KAJ9383759.1 hypothetical protein DTO063F5_5063 [Paecilomyces variotii]
MGSQTVTQFTYLRLKPDVKPEDPTNEAGQQFLQVLRTAKLQSGYQSSSWGRTVEDPDNIVWVVDWADARGAARTNEIHKFQDTSTEMITFYVSLSPSLAETDLLTKNPVTELVGLAFPSDMTPDEQKKVHFDLIAFRTALLEKMDENLRPVSWSMGHVSRPGTVDHANSPSGKALLHMLAVGWESVDAHKNAKETQVYWEVIKPLREKMLPPPKGLEMRHAKLTKI